MSRGQLARTPENFPRMKFRARGRIFRRHQFALFQLILTTEWDELLTALANYAAEVERISTKHAAAAMDMAELALEQGATR